MILGCKYLFNFSIVQFIIVVTLSIKVLLYSLNIVLYAIKHWYMYIYMSQYHKSYWYLSVDRTVTPDIYLVSLISLSYWVNLLPKWAKLYVVTVGRYNTYRQSNQIPIGI